MLIIGTAGHIDHGKSAIVRRLTGTDPDRLPEEKARGMTIDLGFAFRMHDQRREIAFVDVPGHERFVKNMIAGAGGIDVVMLVVAADDGWMPQSQEHFQIVRLLGIERGIIVINKIDLVGDPDWIDLLEADIRDKTAGSFLAEAPIFRVSAQTGEGIDKLAEHIDHLADEAAAEKDIDKARLYIDRSFVLLGIGGVVTGTLRDGSFSVGQSVTIWPSGTSGKIRSLRANDTEVEQALPGQRTAVSVSGVDKEQLVRGGVVMTRESIAFFRDNQVLALSVELIPEAKLALTNRRRVVFITGATEVEGEIRLYRRRTLKAGESGILFFKPDEPVLSLIGDRFIVRLPTPMVTLGGGRIIDHLPHFPRMRSIEEYRYLEQRDGDLRTLIISELEKRLAVDKRELLHNAAISDKKVQREIKALVQDRTVGVFRDMIYHRSTMETAVEAMKKHLLAFLDERSHLKGIPRDQMIQISRMPEPRAEMLIEYMLSEGILVRSGETLNLVGRGMSLKGKVKQLHDDILKQITENPYTPPRLPDLVKLDKEAREAIKYILEAEEGHKCGAEFVFAATVWKELVRFIREALNRNGELTVAALKDRFGLTRKFAIPVLEETDRLKFTRRDGDRRIKGERFEDEEFDL
ncbi:MAG TPA: selenocysteine-specific translation elongation factor [candidate division Zixibacteria bacterium]|nr:selenocysteine-specific translation elongation factor [candidate division Zixibacteria bacterium]